LVAQINRRVRFEEVDALGIVWHGRYPSYMEDGRMAFGEKFGFGYMDMFREKFLAPVVQMHIEYHSPLVMEENFTIIASLHWSEAARLNFQYQIVADAGRIAATGYTVQLLLSPERELLLTRPPFVEEICARWRENRLHD
jgi:acyl-CoA thioester hydrolase